MVALQNFFESKGQEGGGTEQQAVAKRSFAGAPEGDKYVPNWLTIRAVDHALQSLGLSLKDFKATQTLPPLGQGEMRYGLRPEDFPAGFAAVDRRRRSCVANEKDPEKRRLEVAWVGDCRRQLHLLADRGPCQFLALQWLFTTQNLVGSWMPDPLHMMWGDVQRVVKDAGLWSCFLEIVVAAGYKGGPWKGSSHLQSVRDAAADYQALVTPEADALFGVLYEDIARDMKRFRPTVAGSPEHLREIREKALDDLQNLGKGRRIKISRWFSFFDVAAELEERWHLELWLLVFLGIENKWFDNAASSPLGHRFSHDGKDVSSSAAGPCEEAFSVKSVGQAPATVKHSNQEIAEMRRNSKNSCTLQRRSLAVRRPGTTW